MFILKEYFSFLLQLTGYFVVRHAYIYSYKFPFYLASFSWSNANMLPSLAIKRRNRMQTESVEPLLNNNKKYFSAQVL